jgi:hypothetical protein
MYLFLAYLLGALLALEVGWWIGRRFSLQHGNTMRRAPEGNASSANLSGQLAVTVVLDAAFQAEIATTLRQLTRLSQLWGDVLVGPPDMQKQGATTGGDGTTGVVTADSETVKSFIANEGSDSVQAITIVDRVSIGSSSATNSVGEISGFYERNSIDSFRIRAIRLTGEFWREDFFESMERLSVREEVESRIQGARHEDRCQVNFSCSFTAGTEPRMQLSVARKVVEWSVDLIPRDNRARRVYVERDLAVKPIFINVRLE